MGCGLNLIDLIFCLFGLSIRWERQRGLGCSMLVLRPVDVLWSLPSGKIMLKFIRVVSE